MKKILVSIILLFPFLLKSQTMEVSGIQEGLWNCDTVLVIKDVIVPEDKSLTISEGTRIIFKDYFSIIVNGSFKALGSETDSIYFTARDTTGFFNWKKGKGGWNGLVLQNTKDTVILDYCHFSFGKSVNGNSRDVTSVASQNFGGALRIYNSCVNITNATFYYNLTNSKGGALYAEHSLVKIANCEVDSNFGFNEEGVYMHGAGFQFSNCDVEMEDMYFHDNYCANCYGGGANFDSCNVYVNNAIFEDNYAVNAAGMGIQRSNDYEVKIYNCLFNNNISYHYGGAMAMATSSPLIQNVTMTNNYTIAAGGGALQFYSEARPVFKNCIIWGNDWYGEHNAISDGSQIFVWGSDCAPEFYNSILQGGYKEIHGNSSIAVYDTATMFDSDPMFVDIQNRDFHLLSGSPAINKGSIDIEGVPSKDLSGNPRIVGNRIDIGCYESVVTSLKEINHKNINIYPNPINQNSICEFLLRNTSNVNVKIYNPNASLIFIKNYGKMQPGMNKIHMSDFIKSLKKNNVYLLNIESEEETKNIKFVY
ncbi:MAG: right-handed parallel beta-helix repeat-containing protein [Bacteroidales bacterium]|nr:right-handed parallel beta-helix repeat-containing protein [Bacteroidales bacterium]